MQPMPLESSVGEEAPELVTVIVICGDHTRRAVDLDDWSAATLLACVSEDPADWAEITAVWPRYQSGPAPEFADALPVTATDLETALQQLRPDEAWLVLDLPQQRVFSSSRFGDVRRDGSFAAELPRGECPIGHLSIHLPPWWEIHNDAGAEQVRGRRTTRARRPQPRRDILWGRPLADALAERLLAVFSSPGWLAANAAEDSSARYVLTIQVHRDWLMTAREDLDGRMPRESLHGGIEWLDGVITGQQWNVCSGGEPIRIPHDFSSYETGPLGRAEVCMYFDLCRGLIEHGWQWLIKNSPPQGCGQTSGTARRLADELERAKQTWLQTPFEGGSPPRCIIQDERDRIPHMESGGQDGHVIHCDCPICKMMAEGLFGPAFVFFDGHHLELDDEFAFSLWETREQWELERISYGDFEVTSDEGVAEDELASAWRGSFVADHLPGDPDGHLGISFRLADIIGELQMRSAPQTEIDALNAAFVEYRQAPAEQRLTASKRFQDVLEQMAQRHEFLLGRSADLQSRLDELTRRRTPADDVPY